MNYVFFCSRLDTMFEKRKELLCSLIGRGDRVVLCSMEPHNETESKLKAIGVELHIKSCPRNKIDIIKDFRYVVRILFLLLRVKPDVLVSYTIKPNLYCGIALRFFPRIRFYPVVTGLGYAFQGMSFKRSILRMGVIFLHRLSFSRATKVIFQNYENMGLFEEKSISSSSKNIVIEGDGILLPDSIDKCVNPNRKFVCIARLLGEKGLRELNEAAALVRKKHKDFNVEVYGPEETSPDAITREEILKWNQQGGLKWKGYCDNVGEVLKLSDVFVLPSYHEGMSTAVCEAISHGVPIVGTDIAGIREMVQGNGILVPVRDARTLAKALEKMLTVSDDEIKKMGRFSRDMAVAKFDRFAVMKRIEEVIV